jgi:mRNA-degrading endonuclease toxin of MazEF toxin-antitoxin module
VAIPQGTAGLSLASLAVCHQVTTLDRGKLGAKLGELPANLIAEVGEALKRALALV